MAIEMHNTKKTTPGVLAVAALSSALLGVTASTDAASLFIIDDFTADLDTINGSPAPGGGVDVIELTHGNPVGTGTYTNTTLYNGSPEDSYAAALTATLTSGQSGTTVRVYAGGLGILATSSDSGSKMTLKIEYTLDASADWAAFNPSGFGFDFLEFEGVGNIRIGVDGVYSSKHDIVSYSPAPVSLSISAAEVGGAANLASVDTFSFEMEYTLAGTDSLLNDLVMSLQGPIIPAPAAAFTGLAGLASLMTRRRR